MAPVPASTRIGERPTRERYLLTTLGPNGSQPMPFLWACWRSWPPNGCKSPGIDRVQNIIRIGRSKGRKDRNVMLSRQWGEFDKAADCQIR